MKKQFVTSLLGLGAILASCAQPSAGNYSVSAVLSPDENDFMAYLVDYDSGARVDSVIIADGKAVFKGYVKTPALTRLMIEGERLGSFILEPGDIVFNIETKEAIGGDLNVRMNKINADLAAIVNEFRQLPRDSVFEQKASELERKYNSMEEQAFSSNLDNPIGYYFFINRAFEMDKAELDKALVQYPQFAGSKRIAKIKESLQLKEETSPGHKFKDFEITYEGKTTRLSDYVGRGKWVLVDFWASWCGPCIRETAVIKDILKEYGPKGLEVLGVAVWDEPAATLKGIETHQLPWPQIINAQNIPTDLYGISGIPCIILFDPEGNIVSRDKQDDELRAAVKAAMDKAAAVNAE